MVIVSDCSRFLSANMLLLSTPDSTYSSCSIGVAIEGERGGIWADGGVDINGRGNPGLVGPGRGGSGQRGNDGELGELHFD
jgi:hypothetical protein